MANELVRFTMGPQDDLSDATKRAGQILFALNDDKTGSIYFDKDNTNRYRLSYDLKDTASKFTISAAAVQTTTGRVYPVALDKDGYLAVNVPWSNTTYSAGNGISISGTTINNTGIRTLAIGSSNGKTKVNGTDTSLVYGLKDLAYIAIDDSSSTKYLRGDGTWASLPSPPSYLAGTGLKMSGTTFSAKLKSETAASVDSNAITTTSDRYYAVGIDKSGYLTVNVPWNNDINTSADGKGITLDGSVYKLSLKDKTTAFTKAAVAISTPSSNSRIYPVGLDKDGYLSVAVPWDNTTYSAGNGISISGTTIHNSGVRSIATGTANGTISVNTNGTSADVAVKGLTDVAFLDYPTTAATSKFLRGDGTWQTPTDHTYLAGSGLDLTGNTFSIKTGGVTNAMLANSAITIAGNSVSLGSSLSTQSLKSSLGITNAMHFIGKATVEIVDGSTQDPIITGYTFSNAEPGDVILDKDGYMEYIWSSAGKWEAFGSEWTATTSTSGTAIDFVTGISYNGATVLVSKSTVRSASTNQTGVIKIDAATTNNLLNTLTTGSSVPQDGDYYISQYVGGGTTTTTYHRRPMSKIWEYIKNKADAIYVTEASNSWNVSDAAVAGQYVSTVAQTNGKIIVGHTAFSPTISVTAGANASSAPTVNISINGVSATAQALTKATTGVYGVTKLSSDVSSTEEGLAATPKGVKAAIDAISNFPVSQGGTGISVNPSMLVNLGSTSAATVFQTSPRPGITGTLAVAHGGTGATAAKGAKANLGLGDAKVYHGTCSTAAATAQKDVTLDDADFADAQLAKGVIVFVTFTNTNSAAVGDLKLKVGTSTVKPIKREYNGGTSNLGGASWLRANCTYMFTYDGTNWVNLTDNQNSTYSAMSVAEMQTGTATTSRVMRADYLKTFLSTLGGTGLDLKYDATDGIVLDHHNSITAGTAKSTTTSVGFGGTITIPSITYDSEGHITSTTTTSVTLPSNPNVDTKVNQVSSNSSNADYGVLFTYTAVDSTDRNESARKDVDFKYNPSTNTLTVANVSGNASTATTATKLGTNAGSLYQPVYFTGGKPTIGSGYTIEYIVGTQTAATGSWTGTSKDTALYDGKMIMYVLPYAGSGNATLNLTMADGTTTGAKNVYRYGNTTPITTHYGAGSRILLIYDATNGRWNSSAWYDSNNNTLLRVYSSATDINVPLIGQSSANSTTAAWSTYTATYKDWYGAIPNDDAKRAKINLSTGAMTVPGGITANVTGNASTATKLSNTPNTTTTYLRGDNSWQTLITAGTSTLAWNSEVTIATVGGTAIKAKLPANPNTNTTYTLSGALASHKFTTTLTPSSGSATTSDLTLVAGSNITLTDDTTNRKITIAATDTKYTAGTGLSLSGTTFNHSNSITAKTAAAQSAKTLTWGGTFTLYEEKYDAQGHVTGVASYNMTMPANPNTDAKVTQSASTASNWRKILLHYKDDSTSTTAVTTSTNQVYAAVGVSVQPSTGTVRADQYNVKDKVQLEYDATTESLNFVFI